GRPTSKVSVVGQHIEIAGPWIMGQVSDFAGDCPARGLGFPGQDSGQRGLPLPRAWQETM
ncbi:MAG TPA: hypothetical protein VJN19_05210, partial [Propionibacteriaceae bacterium]|nr:hypothetical protein [Propionibacteriaceae bacterium]